MNCAKNRVSVLWTTLVFVFSRSRDVKWKCWDYFFYRNLQMSSISKCQNICFRFVIVHRCEIATVDMLSKFLCSHFSFQTELERKIPVWNIQFCRRKQNSLLPVRLYMGFCSSVWWCSLITGNAKHGTKHSWDLACCLLWRMSKCFAPCQETWWSTGLVVSDSGGEQRTGKAGRMPVSSLCVD